MDCVYTALSQPMATQSALEYCPTFIHTFTNTFTTTFMHTFTHQQRCQPCRATASWSGAVRVRVSCSGTLTLGNRTSNFRVTSQPALPPEPPPPQREASRRVFCRQAQVLSPKALRVSGVKRHPPDCVSLHYRLEFLLCFSNQNLLLKK